MQSLHEANAKPGRSRVDSINLRDIPADLKADFKAYCSKRGYSMKDALVYLMRQTVRRNKRLAFGDDA